jgi:hypothetical protein
MPSDDVRARREAVVREHMDSENVRDFDTTIATFGHPRYELVATGDVYDGEDAVRAYFAESRRAFPDHANASTSTSSRSCASSALPMTRRHSPAAWRCW